MKLFFFFLLVSPGGKGVVSGSSTGPLTLIILIAFPFLWNSCKLTDMQKECAGEVFEECDILRRKSSNSYADGLHNMSRKVFNRLEVQEFSQFKGAEVIVIVIARKRKRSREQHNLVCSCLSDHRLISRSLFFFFFLGHQGYLCVYSDGAVSDVGAVLY